MSFENFYLRPELLRGITELGFVSPTPIQLEAIPEIIAGENDFIGLAQTGTGKTAAYGLPMAQRIHFEMHTIQGLVLCPTRELCVQITRNIQQYCRYVKGAKVIAVYGGAGLESQQRRIKEGAQIVVATPGRLLDFMQRKVIDLSTVDYVVLDEADEMLDMGFQEDIDVILDQTPKDKRIWLFSATMPGEVSRIARRYMEDPREVTIGQKNSGAENINHIYFVVKEKDRYPALKRVIDFHPDIYGLVFCRTRKETQEIAEKLIKDGYNAESLHGDHSQQIRDQVMHRYREKNIRVLIATDVAARGLDVQDITHVINYKLPDEADHYTHRSGRTGRAGKTGMSIAIINARETGKLQRIEKQSGIQFANMKIPTGRAICENQLFAMVNKLVAVEVDQAEIGKFLPPVYQTLKGLTKETLIQRFVSLEFNRFLSYYKDAVDINGDRTAKDRPGKMKKTTKSFGDYTKQGTGVRRIFMNAGSRDNIVKGTIIRNVCEKAGIPSAAIGKVEILREFSFFELKAGMAPQVLKAMKGAKIDGRDVRMQYAENDPPVKKNKKKKIRKKNRRS